MIEDRSEPGPPKRGGGEYRHRLNPVFLPSLCLEVNGMSETKVKPVKKKMNKAEFKEHCWGLAFVSPPFIGFLIFMAFPIVFAFVASLTKWNGMNDMMSNFVGGGKLYQASGR